MQSPIRLTESSYAWSRLFASLFISTVGSAGMYLVVIILPEIQNDFGVSRGAASFSYTMVMLGFGLGGILFGRLVDLHGILKPLMISVLALATSFVVTGMVRTIYMLYLMHFMIGFSDAQLFLRLWYRIYRNGLISVEGLLFLFVHAGIS